MSNFRLNPMILRNFLNSLRIKYNLTFESCFLPQRYKIYELFRKFLKCLDIFPRIHVTHVDYWLTKSKRLENCNIWNMVDLIELWEKRSRQIFFFMKTCITFIRAGPWLFIDRLKTENFLLAPLTSEIRETFVYRLGMVWFEEIVSNFSVNFEVKMFF